MVGGYQKAFFLLIKNYENSEHLELVSSDYLDYATSDSILKKSGKTLQTQRGPLSSPLYYHRARRFKFSRGKNVGSASLHSTVGQYLHMLKLQFSK